MFLGNVSAQNDIIGAAMQANAARESAMLNNLANQDTPNYKKYEVAFEDQLRLAVEKYQRTGELDLSEAVPVVNRIHTTLSSRLDGNNVDVNEENINLYQTSVVYDSLAESVISNYRILNLVLNMRS